MTTQSSVAVSGFASGEQTHCSSVIPSPTDFLKRLCFCEQPVQMCSRCAPPAGLSRKCRCWKVRWQIGHSCPPCDAWRNSWKIGNGSFVYRLHDVGCRCVPCVQAPRAAAAKMTSLRGCTDYTCCSGTSYWQRLRMIHGDHTRSHQLQRCEYLMSSCGSGGASPAPSHSDRRHVLLDSEASRRHVR